MATPEKTNTSVFVRFASFPLSALVLVSGFASSFLNCMQIGFNFLLPKNIWQRCIGNQNTRHRRDFIASCHVAGTFETRTQKARAAKNVSLAEGFVLSIFGSG